MVDITFVPMGNDDYDVVPHAIFWRPIVYFSSRIREESDNLDEYNSASFCVGNRFSFSIKHYKQHLPDTASLYFSLEMQDDEEIDSNIDTVIRGLKIPVSAVGWRRGGDFVPGQLKRRPQDRLRESEARITILKIAALCQNHTASTNYIKRTFRDFYPLSALDMKQSKTRRNEKLWQQIVGNVISHRSSSSGPFVQGLAVRTADGLTVSAKGLDYLKSCGFSI